MANTDLPPHIQNTLGIIERLHTSHHERASPSQRVANRMTAALAMPCAAGFMTLAIVGWIVGNLAARHLGLIPWDAPPFPWLQGATCIGALYMTVLILATQRHDGVLESHREQLTLELAMLSEQKSAKIIQLLEELRHDDPLIRDRHDEQAEVMAKPADPNAVLGAIREPSESPSRDKP